MPFDGFKIKLSGPRSLPSVLRAAEYGQICREAALTFIAWAEEGPSPNAPPPPPSLSNREDERQRAAWRQRFADWYLWHSTLRENLTPRRPASAALHEGERIAAPHIDAARKMLEKLRRTGHLVQTDIPRGWDPLAEGRLDALRRRLERVKNRKKARHNRLMRLDDEGGFFRSLRSVALMRLVQSIHAPPDMRVGLDKARTFAPEWKIEGLDLPYVEGNKKYRSLLRVDVDESFQSLDALRDAIKAAGVPLPNIVSWMLPTAGDDGDNAEAIRNPHLVWLLEKPVWWQTGNPGRLLWRQTLGRLNDALLGLGADPNGMLNPMRIKNPLCPEAGFAVFDDIPWNLKELLHRLPSDGEALDGAEPRLLDSLEEEDGGSQKLFLIAANYANARARELKNDPDGRRKLDAEVLALHEERHRLYHGTLSPAQVQACQRAAARISAFAWALAHRGRPAKPDKPDARRLTPGEREAAVRRGNAVGGLTRAQKFQEKLERELPDAIEAYWTAERREINPSRLSRYIDASIVTLQARWDLVIRIAEQKMIPVKRGYLEVRQEQILAKRERGRRGNHERIEAIEKGHIEVPERRLWPWAPDATRRRPRRSRTTMPKTWPQAQRGEHPLRVKGLAIGRPKFGDPIVRDLQACVDEIVARMGGHSIRLSYGWSDQVLKDLTSAIKTRRLRYLPETYPREQRFVLEVLNRRWLSASSRPKSLAKAKRAFPRVPIHMLKRALERGRGQPSDRRDLS